MALVLTALLSALAGATVGPLIAASRDVRRNDQRIRERDGDLEEWLVTRHRRFEQRLSELRQELNAAGVLAGGAPIQARRATATIALYDYREELRQARADRARIISEETWAHDLMRRLRGRRVPELITPNGAAPLIDHWNDGTDGNAMTWTLADITREITGANVRDRIRLDEAA